MLRVILLITFLFATNSSIWAENTTPQVGIANQVNGAVVMRPNSTIFQVPIRFRFENLGACDLTQLEIRDDLAVNFNLPASAITVNSVELIFLTDGLSTIAINPAYTGVAPNDNLLADTGNFLVAGDKGTIQLMLTIDFGKQHGKFYNQATIIGYDANGNVDTDLSDQGKYPDENPFDFSAASGPSEDDPTEIYLGPKTHIGLAQQINGPVSRIGNSTTFEFPIRFRMENFGDYAFTNIQLLNDLAENFNVAASAISIETAPFLVFASTGSTLQTNPNYTGVAPNDNLLAETGNLLLARDKATVQLVVRVDFGTAIGIFTNQATIIAEDVNGIVDMDVSDEGKKADKDPYDGIIAGGAIEEDPTRIILEGPTQVALALQVNGNVTQVGTSTQFTFPLRYRIENMGTTDLVDVELLNDLATNLGVAPSAVTINSAPSLVFVTTGSTLQMNTNYSGAIPRTNLLASSGNLLLPGHKATIQLNVTVDFGTTYGSFTNQAAIIGEDENGIVDIDLSDEGKVWDEDGSDLILGSGALENDPTKITIGTNPVAKPNVVFFVIDDLNDWVGVMGGHPDAITPNIDALAANGTLFRNAQSNAVFCNPSRVSVITGLKPYSSGVTQNGADFEPWRDIMNDPNSNATKHFGANAGNLKSLFNVFDDNGYHVATTGKVYHAPSQLNAETWDDNREVYESFLPETIANHPLNGLTSYTAANNSFNDWGAIEDAININTNLPYTEEESDDYRITQNALNMIDDLPASDPFFLNVGLIRPHIPIYVPERFIDMYKDASGNYTVSVPANVLLNDQADTPFTTTMKHRNNIFAFPDRWQALTAHYLAAITWIDDQIGQVMNKLEQEGLLENTIIVLAGDHGYHLGEKQFFKKGTLWREARDVPFIISAPNMNTNTITDSIVSLIDIFPTLTDLAGIEMPTDVPRDGRSLRPLLENPNARWPWLSDTDMYDPKTGFIAKGLRTHLQNYNAYQIDNPFPPAFNSELYDLENDPNEWYNLMSTINGDPLVYAEQEKHFNEIIEGQFIPNKAPEAMHQMIPVPNLSLNYSIELKGKDINKDYLLFKIKQLPTQGTLYESTDGITLGNPISQNQIVWNKPGWSAHVIYLPNNNAVGQDYFTFETTDGAYSSTGFVSLTFNNNSPNLRLEEDEVETAKQNFSLQPNPTKYATEIHYDIDKNTEVNISIYTVAGEQVRFIQEGQKEKGSYMYPLNTIGWVSGIYMIVLEKGTEKMVQQLLVD